MKKNRTLRGLAIATAALVGIYVGSTALAQNKPAGAATPLRTRVAFLNLHETLKNYNKVKALREEMKGKEEEFMKALKAKQTRGEGLVKESQDPKTTAARKDQIEQEIKQIQFDMEQMRNDTKKTVTKYYTDRMAEFFRETYQVIAEYAAANGIDVVLQYNEEWDTEYHSAPRVVQRMNLPFWPVYYDQKTMDITGNVATALNQRFAVVNPVGPKNNAPAGNAAAGNAPAGNAPAGNGGVVPASGQKQP